MNIIWSLNGWQQYLYWQRTDKNKLKRINELIKSVMRTPYEGIGNPEPLKYELQGFWSRRIDSENRLIYKINNDDINIVSCRFHY